MLRAWIVSATLLVAQQANAEEVKFNPSPYKYYGPVDTPEAERVLDIFSRFNQGPSVRAELQDLSAEAVRTRNLQLSAVLVNSVPHTLISQIKARQPEEIYIDQVVLLLLRASKEIWQDADLTGYQNQFGAYTISLFCLPSLQRNGATYNEQTCFEALNTRDSRLEVANRLAMVLAKTPEAISSEQRTPNSAVYSKPSEKLVGKAGENSKSERVVMGLDDHPRQWLWICFAVAGFGALLVIWARGRE